MQRRSDGHRNCVRVAHRDETAYLRPVNQRTLRLGTEPVFTVLSRLALPATASLLINATYNVVDSLFVGRLVGTVGLAAVGLNFPLQIFIISVGVLIGVGGSSLISRRLGAGASDGAQRAFASAVLLILAGGLVIATIGGSFSRPLSRLIGASPAVLPFAHDYFLVTALGAPFLIANQALNNIVYAEGAGAVGFLALTLSSIANILLDWLFLGPLGMGVRGAAIATVISQAAATLFLLFYFSRSGSQLSLGLCWCRDDLREILRIGSAAALRTVSVVIMGLVINRSALRVGGDLAVAVASVVLRVVSLVVLPALGINQAYLPVAAYNFGAHQFDRTVRATWQAVVMALVVCSLASGAIIAFAPQIARAFNPDPRFVSLASAGFRTAFMLTPLIIFNLVAGGLFQALGEARMSLIVSVSRVGFFFVPLQIIMPRLYGLPGIWLAFPVGEVLAMLFAVGFALPRLLKLSRPAPAAGD